MRQIFLASFLLLISGTAHAAGPTATPLPTGQAQATLIETDQKAGAIKIILNGKEVTRFDAHGLHVRDGIEYAGKETDLGTPANYDKLITAEPKH